MVKRIETPKISEILYEEFMEPYNLSAYKLDLWSLISILKAWASLFLKQQLTRSEPSMQDTTIPTRMSNTCRWSFLQTRKLQASGYRAFHRLTSSIRMLTGRNLQRLPILRQRRGISRK